MTIWYGHNRLAIKFFCVVIKIPRVDKVLQHLKRVTTKKARPLWDRTLTLLILRGLFANITESLVYFWTRSPLLTPVVSCGFVSIQKFECGEIPSRSEIWKNLERLPEKAKACLWCMDAHHFDSSNWRKTEKGLRWIDYGDKFGENVSLSLWIYLPLPL